MKAITHTGFGPPTRVLACGPTAVNRLGSGRSGGKRVVVP